MKTQCLEHKTQIFPTTCGSCVILQKLQKWDAKTETGPTTATPISNFAFYSYYKCCIETSEYSKDYYGLLGQVVHFALLPLFTDQSQ